MKSGFHVDVKLLTVGFWSHSHSAFLYFFHCDPTTLCGLVLETRSLKWYNIYQGREGGRKEEQAC